MSLIGLLGRAGTAFVGGAAGQVNVAYAAKRKAEAARDAAEAEQAGKIALLEEEARIKADAERVAREAEETRELEAITRNDQRVFREYKALSGMETEKQPYIGYDDRGYSTIKFVDLVDKVLDQQTATNLATSANTDLAKKGYVQIPVLRDDGRGWKLVLKDLKEETKEKGATFNTVAEAQSYAGTQLSYYDGLGAKMIPEFIPSDNGRIAVQFKEASEAGQESQLFKDEKDAQTYADTQQAYYDSKPEFQGQFYPEFETTEEGIKVTFKRNDGTDKKGGVAQSAAGFDLDVNYLLRVSPKAGTELQKGAFRDFSVISLTGENISRTGKEQENYVEGKDHLVVRTAGVGNNKQDINESFAGFIREDFTPEIIEQIERNKNSGPAGEAAHTTMVSTFRKFINTFTPANTLVAGDVILGADIGERHPWLYELAQGSPELTRLLGDEQIDLHVEGNPIAEANPRNMPVRELDGRPVKDILPNPDLSPFIVDQEQQDGTPVPMLDNAVLNRVEKMSRKKGAPAAPEILKIIHNASDSSSETRPVTTESIQEGYDNLIKIEETLKDAEFTQEGGFSDPGLSTDTQGMILGDLDVYTTYNDKILALSSALPALTIKRAGMKVQATKDNSKEGKYIAVTGGTTSFKIIGEQLENADNMKGSINGLRNAIRGGGETGYVLEAESLVTGAEYLFSSVMENLEFEEGTNGTAIIDSVRKQFDSAKSETDPQKRANALVRVYATMLSYQLARMMDPNGRLSDEDRQTVEGAIGLKGIKATPEKLLLVAEQLEEQVDYIQARNKAYSTGNVRTIMGAHLYNQISAGGNINTILPQIMNNITDDTSTGGSSSGATISPAVQRAMNLTNRQGQRTPVVPERDADESSTPTPAPEPIPEI